MSIKPSTPDHERRIGRRMGVLRAQYDKIQGIRQELKHLWRPPTASPAYVEGLLEGYAAEIGNTPHSLEDLG